MSDASVKTKSKETARLCISQTWSHRDWIIDIKNFLEKNNVMSALTEDSFKIITFPNQKPCIRQNLRTLSYCNFVNYRNRWYPEGKKIVPKDIDISSGPFLANWLQGDGDFKKSKKILRFATHSFTLEDVKWLQEQFLLKLGVESKINTDRGKPVLCINKHASVKKVLDIAKPYIVESFRYKGYQDNGETINFSVKRKPKTDRGSKHAHAKLNEEKVGQILIKSSENITHVSLAEMFGVSPTAIWAIVNRKTWKHVETKKPG
jgi:hypothetical protein